MTGWIWLFTGVLSSAAASMPLKWAQGFSNPGMAATGIGFYIVSMLCWIMALRFLPLGISYIVWTGLGSFLAVVTGILVFQERLNWMMVGYAALVLAGCIGLMTSSKQA